jgi:hypothetical protein
MVVFLHDKLLFLLLASIYVVIARYLYETYYKFELERVINHSGFSLFLLNVILTRDKVRIMLDCIIRFVTNIYTNSVQLLISFIIKLKLLVFNRIYLFIGVCFLISSILLDILIKNIIRLKFYAYFEIKYCVIFIG